jgi:hypothetical protein
MLVVSVVMKLVIVMTVGIIVVRVRVRVRCPSGRVVKEYISTVQIACTGPPPCRGGLVGSGDGGGGDGDGVGIGHDCEDDDAEVCVGKINVGEEREDEPQLFQGNAVEAGEEAQPELEGVAPHEVALGVLVDVDFDDVDFDVPFGVVRELVDGWPAGGLPCCPEETQSFHC